MKLPADFLAMWRLELAEVLRSRWVLFTSGVYAILGAVFVLIGLKESTVLGFTGTGRVLLSFTHALLLVLPLLALTATSQAVNRAREDGTLELLFSHPVGRTAYLLAVGAVRYAVLTLPLLLLFALLSLLGTLVYHDLIPWGMLLRTLSICACLLWAFTGLGLLISTHVRDTARSLVIALGVWALGVALLDFGLVSLMLKWHLTPQAVMILATLNPVQAARMALLSAIEPELAIFGPVGFFLANRMGPSGLLALGLLWPATAGTLALYAALKRFREGDLV